MAERNAELEHKGRHVATLRVDADATQDELRDAAQDWLESDGWDRDRWRDFELVAGRTRVRAA
jgi:hypothetical protein